MTVQRDTLSEALRELAATSPQPSPELGTRLQEAFAQHHVRRRLRRRVAVAAGLAACLVTALAWLTTAKQTREVRKLEPPAEVGKMPAPERQLVAPKQAQPSAASMKSAAAKPRGRGKQLSKARDQSVEAPVVIAAGDFIALPSFDSAVPLGDSRMLRVDLPGSALQQIGYPIDGQLLDRRIVADVLVGQDGSPYAVRLVNARNLH
jgi:hypothetical protein